MPPAVAIILNGISRKKKKFYRDIYPALAKKFKVEVFETQRAGHAVELAATAKRQSFQLILAAGGDGTLNQLVNGILQADQSGPEPAIGIIPLGTGNDFARTCGITGDVHQLLQLAEADQPKKTDVGKLSCVDQNGNKATRYFINASSIGMGPAVVQRLLKSRRRLGPTITYWKAITATFLTHRPQEIDCNGGTWQRREKIRVLSVANGRSFGNGLYIAPDASVDDGLLNVFVAGDMPLLKFLSYQTALKKPEKIVADMVHYHTAMSIQLESPVPCPIETEGELAGFLPAQIDMIPKGIKFLR